MLESILMLLMATAFQANEEPESVWLRSSVMPDVSAELLIASRRYTNPDFQDRNIWLVGVSHIGDGAFYDSISELMADHDVILYESVMEEASRGASGDTPEEKLRNTNASMHWLAHLAASVELADQAPASMDDLEKRSIVIDRRMVDAVRSTRSDAWGHPLGIARNGNQSGIRSLGRDGLPGGEGFDSDLLVPVVIEGREIPSKGIQESLAEGLKLEFQLAELPYEQSNWIVSDMSWETLQSRFQEEGIQLEGLSGMLEGSSLPAGLVKVLMRLIPILDMMSGGTVTDGLKVALIEILGRNDAIEVAMKQFGDGVGGEILINERNAVVMEDLKAILQADHKDISVLYGAGHMEDLDIRLKTTGWSPVEERWLPAISVDLKESNLSPAEMSMIRTSINMALQRMAQQSRAQ
ncbi:MAG: hypothetical protein CMJ40_06045 [Phycisphaerae bacterium]|nr:hypothetical protein [Phycisphaerae bacterium]